MGGRSKLRRLSGTKKIQCLFEEGVHLKKEWLSLRALPNRLPYSRFTCMVRRRAVPKAVARNRLKRWLREALRRNGEMLPPGVDLVVAAFRGPLTLTFQAVEKTVLQALHALLLRHGSFLEGSSSTGRSP